MKTLQYILLGLVTTLFSLTAQAQSTAVVTANTADISDNLDLQAVASIFGDSRDLEDFEQRLNDPSLQLSNLDLNGDGYVDYLRVIEVADGNKRIVVVQSVLGQDLFQDVATIEIEKQRSSGKVYVQIVGDPFIYGPNYIYEPYYYRTPVFFDLFWSAHYRPYYSPWYWGYYPTYYSYWAPVPVYTYHRHVYRHINTRNRYVYTENRRISRANNIYSSVSRRAYANSNPSRSFASRNTSVKNRHALETRRGVSRDVNGTVSRSNTALNNGRATTRTGIRQNGESRATTSRATGNTTSRGNAVRTSTRVRSDFNSNANVRARQSRVNSTVRNNSRTRVNTSGNRATVKTRSNSAPQRIQRSSTSTRRSFQAPATRSSARPSSNFGRSSSPNMSRSSAPSMSRSSSRSISRPSGMSSSRSSSSRGGGRSGR
ncbi:MAG TPA: hypothetical protein VKY32_02420 [Flavobacterium sp.]|nr:hypothetical protein [Flavobacterium sp.]